MVLDFARTAGAPRVTLLSNHKLAKAIRLYEKIGFRHIELPPDVHYATADVCMEILLRPASPTGL